MYPYSKASDNDLAKGNDLRKTSMLKSFGNRIQRIGQDIIDTEERRKQMAKLIQEYIPVLENIGVNRSDIGEVISRIPHHDYSDAGKLAKNFIDVFYLMREKTGLSESSTTSLTVFVDAVLSREALIRQSVYKSVCSPFRNGDDSANNNEFAMRDLPRNAARLRFSNLDDEEEEDWMVIEKEERSGDMPSSS